MRSFGIKAYGRRLQNKSKNQSVSLGIGQYPISLEKKGKNFYSKILRKITKFCPTKASEIPHEKMK